MKKLKIIYFTILLIFTVSNLAACTANISPYADEKILVTGIGDDFHITPGELEELECTRVFASGSGSAGTTKEAVGYGPTLATFLAEYGLELDDVYYIKFIGGDDYSITLSANTWDKYEVVMAISAGSKKLDEYQRPLRLVIPGSDSGKWIRNIVEIQVTLN